MYHQKRTTSVSQKINFDLKRHDDDYYVLDMCKVDAFSLAYASDRLKRDHAFIFNCVNETRNGWMLRYAHDSIKNDRSIVLMCMQYHGKALCCASQRLKSDVDVVRTAVNSNGIALQYAGKAELKDDAELVIDAVNNDWQAIEFASKRLKDDLGVMTVAVGKSWQALQFASERIRDDENIVLSALSKSWQAIQYASERLRDDYYIAEYVLRASQSMDAVRYLSQDAQLYHVDQIIEIFNRTSLKLSSAPLALRDEFDVVLRSIKSDACQFALASERLRDDYNLASLAVGKYASQFQHASNRLRDCKELAMLAIKSDASQFAFASERLRNDRDLALIAISNNITQLRYTNLANDQSFMLDVLNANSKVFQYMTEAQKDDESVVSRAIASDFKMIKFASARIKASDFMLNLCKRDRRFISYAPKAIKALLKSENENENE